MHGTMPVPEGYTCAIEQRNPALRHVSQVLTSRASCSLQDPSPAFVSLVNGAPLAL